MANTLTKPALQGWWPARPPGFGAALSYVRHLREAATRRADAGEDARRLAVARARAIELRTAREEGELVPAEEAVALTTLLVSELVTALDNLPVRVSRDPTIRDRIEAEINAIREAMAKRLVVLEEQYAALGGGA
jgi:phage terminase Nu1 subunit (DNA packaging protein)